MAHFHASSIEANKRHTNPIRGEEFSGDVNNWENTEQRWTEAIEYFRKSCATLREGSTGSKCCVNAVIDVSGSMDGKKLIAVKLGICSLVANLDDTDELNITAFSGRCKAVTHGFKTIISLKDKIPLLLHQLQTDGCTACFDAIIAGIKDLRQHTHHSIAGIDAPPCSQKNVLIVLTDGEDNESSHKSSHVLQHIVDPGIDKFSFLLVAADMRPREESAFRSWIDLVHCKQVSVSVKTGTKLVSVFKEMLLSRILQTDIESNRFLQSPGTGIDIDLSKSILSCEDESNFQILRKQFVRRVQIKDPTRGLESGVHEECDDISDCDSDGVSRCYSCSSDGMECDDIKDYCYSDEDEDDEDVLSVSLDGTGCLGGFDVIDLSLERLDETAELSENDSDSDQS